MVLLISHRRLPVVHNFCFKSLLLLQFLDHSEFFTWETRHTEPLCNKARMSKFHKFKFHLQFHEAIAWIKTVKFFSRVLFADRSACLFPVVSTRWLVRDYGTHEQTLGPNCQPTQAVLFHWNFWEGGKVESGVRVRKIKLVLPHQNKSKYTCRNSIWCESHH